MTGNYSGARWILQIWFLLRQKLVANVNCTILYLTSQKSKLKAITLFIAINDIELTVRIPNGRGGARPNKNADAFNHRTEQTTNLWMDVYEINRWVKIHKLIDITRKYDALTLTISAIQMSGAWNSRYIWPTLWWLLRATIFSKSWFGCSKSGFGCSGKLEKGNGVGSLKLQPNIQFSRNLGSVVPVNHGSRFAQVWFTGSHAPWVRG